MITVDFVVKLPDAHGYDAIMNVVDSVGKRAHFMPIHTTVNVEGAAWLYLKEVWKLHRLPCSPVNPNSSHVLEMVMWCDTPSS